MEKGITFQHCFFDVDSLSLKNYPNDFVIIVNGNEFKMPRFYADLISPTINNLHSVDESITSYSIITKNSFSTQKIKSIFGIQSTFIPFGEIPNLIDLMTCLGNDSIINEIIGILYQDKITIDNVVSRIQTKKKMNILVDCNEEIDFLAKRFYKFSSNDQLKVLDLETLCDILTNPNLCLYDESCLLYFILDLVKEDKKFYCLFEYLEFTELTVNDIEMFINIFNINYLSGSIWKSLCSRLVQKINYESSITRYSNDINTTEHYPVFDPNDNNANQKMNGIIRYLSEKCNGNIMEKNVINIKSSDEHPINISSIVDLDVDSSFYTSAKPGSFIMIDFKDNFVIPQFYSIKSAGFANLRSWVFEISSDGENWKEIDRHDDSADLKKKKYNFYLSNS